LPLPPPPPKLVAVDAFIDQAVVPGRDYELITLEGETITVDSKGNRTVTPWALPLRRFTGPKHPAVPAVDPHYVFREDLVRELLWAVWPHDDGAPSPALLVGPKGCGKTTLVYQIAALCNVPVYRINLNVGTSPRHLKGHKGAEAGKTVFRPGIASQAIEDGAWLLLDEISGATPPVALSLFPVLEHDGAVYLEEAQPPRYARRHADFRVFGTDNTIGAEQESTRFDYAGTNPDMNIALLDRFGSTMQVGYLPPEQEHAVAKGHAPGIRDVDLEGLIRVANDIRASEAGVAFSTRMVINWARRVAAGHLLPNGMSRPLTDREILQAAYPAFLARMRSKIERDAIAEVFRRTFELEGDA
jgi:MoxR-like ATPase